MLLLFQILIVLEHKGLLINSKSLQIKINNFIMSDSPVYESIPLSQTGIRRYSQLRQPKYFHSQVRKMEKLYTQNTHTKKSGEPSIHRHLNTVHPTHSHKTHKTKQQLLQQNFQIKAYNNELKKQLSTYKIQVQNQKKKTKNMTSKLNREFRKDLYYSTAHETNNPNNSYMVTGIKNQYEQLKQKYQALKQEMQVLKRTSPIQHLNELKIYSGAVEEQNNRLLEKINILNYKLSNDQSKRVQAYQSQFEYKIQKITKSNRKLKEQNKQLIKQDTQNRKVITFLEKIILSKNNSQHKAKNTAKLILRKNEELCRKLKAEEQQSEYLLKQYEEDMAKLQKRCSDKSEKQSEIYKNALAQKSEKIKKLEKQLAYLGTIISYWKPNNDSGVQQKKQYNVADNPQYSKMMDSSDAKQQNLMLSSKKLGHDDNGIVNMPNSNQSGLELDKQIQREGSVKKRKTSSWKHSEQSKKMRKVNVDQLAEVSEFLKYRLIGRNITIEQAQHQFTLPTLTEPYSPDNDYITHREVSATLQSEPFLLKQKQAFLLARYIVEDQCECENGDPSNVFVYCHEQNQAPRGIVKSIIRAFIINYNLPDVGVAEKQWQLIMKKDGARLTTVLSSIAPNQTIKKERWNDIITGMVTSQITKQLKQWLVGVMLVNSQNLSTLRYKAVTEKYNNQ